MKLNIKTYIGLTAAVIGAGALAACDDFLDVTPESSFSSGEIFASETETKAMMGTIYGKLTNNNLYGIAWPHTFNFNTDVEMRTNSSQTSTSGNGDDVHCFDVRSLWSSLENTWNAAYEAINYSNDFLENMETSPLFSQEVDPEKGPSAMQQMYGEVKCLRAMIYLDLIRTWGDVVFRTSSSKAGDDFYNETVTDRNEIMAWLIEDLRKVEEMMVYASTLTEGVERAGREFCQALIGQLALYRGGYSLMPGGENGVMERQADYLDYYKIAREYLGKVIREGRHSLEKETFAQMWYNECNWTVIDDGDVIFEIPMLKESSSNYGYNVGVTIGYNSDNPSHIYGSATNRVTLCGIYPFTFDQRDLRLDVTCVPYKYDEELNQAPSFSGSCVAGWGIGKWNKLNMGTPMASYAGSTGINAIRMRYADVLLMYAEVVNELSGPVSEAKEALKTVRRRAFEPALQAEMVDNYVDQLVRKEDFFEAIVNERAWEFGGEGIRKYDLARWNRYGKTIAGLYEKLIDWGKRANGNGVPGDVRDVVYYRELSDPAYPNRIVLEFKGLKEYGDNIGDHPVSEGWRYRQDYAINWWTRNAETGDWEPHDDVKWSFRGYININNATGFNPEAVTLRNLCPYPTRIITSHRGSIQQQYGYR